MDEPDEILAAAFRRVLRDLERVREDAIMDDDWIDAVEDRVRDLFRDLVVLAGLADRAVDWEADGQPDPLEEIKSPPSTRVTRKELRQLLQSMDLRSDCAPEDLSMSEDADGAVDAARRTLRLLPRLAKVDDDLEALQAQVEQLLGIET